MRSTPTLLGLAALHLALILACGKGADTAPPEAPEGTWRDTQCGLVWQQALGEDRLWLDAPAYCEGLELGGMEWRLPGIGELRCLVNGCPETALDGACEVTDDCGGIGCLTTACEGCGEAGGEVGCYWSSLLEGACTEPLWSATPMSDEAAWVLHFRDGSISPDAVTELHAVRCVSDG
jgi:hypothetical protein